jgi:hypothetical protein
MNEEYEEMSEAEFHEFYNRLTDRHGYHEADYEL